MEQAAPDIGNIIASILAGGVLGFLGGLYFNTKQAVAIHDQTKEILLMVGNAFNALHLGEDFEVRVTVEGKATVVKFARTKSAAASAEAGIVDVKND